MGLLDLCEKYFQTKNLYEVLEITVKASDKEGKPGFPTRTDFFSILTYNFTDNLPTLQ